MLVNEQAFHKPPVVDYLRERSSEKEKVSAVAGSAGVNWPYSFILVESTDGCYMDSGDFPNLDTVLTEAGAFPKLRQVSLEVAWDLSLGIVKSQSSDSGTPYRLERFQFPQLCRSPTIDFSCCSKKY